MYYGVGPYERTLTCKKEIISKSAFGSTHFEYKELAENANN